MFALPRSPQIWYPLIAALIAIGLLAYARPRRFTRGGRPFIAFVTVFCFLFLLQTVTRAADTLSLKVLLYQLWIALAAWATLFGLWLALEYAGLLTRAAPRLWVLLAIPLTVFSVLALTNGVHKLLWSRFWFDDGLRAQLTPAGVAAMLYLSLFGLLSPLILLVVSGRAHGLLRRQAALLVVAALLVWVTLPTEIFSARPLATSGWSTWLSVAAMAVSLVALFKYRAFDLAPIARDDLVEQSSHGMLVLDEEHRVVDLNPAAERILGPAGKHAIGRQARQVLGQWPELLRMATYGAGTHAEVTVSDGNDNRIYEATVSPFLDLTGGSMARLIVWFEVTEAKAAQAELERQRAALAASIERDRVARELHDGLAQTLAFVKMQAQAARDALERDCADQAFEDISAMLPVVQDAHEEIRDFMLGAKRAPRDAGNFWAAVADFTERFSSVYGLKVYTVIPPEVGRLKIDPLTQVQLLRVIQESLSNVRKHARVQSASLTFSADKHCLRVVIHDDGIGFDKDSVAGAEAGHYGLMIMRERAEEIRGHVDIISEQGKGTAVFVEVPLGGKDKERSRAFAASR